MEKRDSRQYEMLIRVRDFGVAHHERFPTSSLAAGAFAAVASSVQALSDHAVARLALRRLGTRAKAAARRELANMMRAISRTARVAQADEPAFPNTFKMPTRKSAHALLTAARLFARDLEPFAPTFIAHAMPDTFVAEFTRLLDAYEHAVHARELGKGETAAARASVRSALAAGLSAVRRLDVIVANHARHDPALVAEWARDRRVDYPRGSSKAATSPGASTAASAPATPIKAVLAAVSQTAA